jgi:hypothetical protein
VTIASRDQVRAAVDRAAEDLPLCASTAARATPAAEPRCTTRLIALLFVCFGVKAQQKPVAL